MFINDNNGNQMESYHLSNRFRKCTLFVWPNRAKDFCVAGCLVHGFLQQVFRSSFEEQLFKEFDRDLDETAKSADPRIVETLAFHSVNSSRLRHSIQFLESNECQWSLLLLSVALEPNRSLTWYFLSCIGKSLKEGERPPLFQLLDPRSSIVYQVLQHFSSLLLSSHGDGRLNLLWHSGNYHDFQAFCHSEVSKCRKIRRILLLEAAWVYRRHFQYLNSDPFALTMCGDDNAHPETLKSVLEFWDVKSHCCLQPGLCRDLKRKGLTSKDLMSGKYKTMLYWTASTFQCSIADVESMHSQNRIFAGNAFSNIAAKFVNAESKRIEEEASKLQGHEAHGSGSASRKWRANGIEILDATELGRNPKALSALEIFRKHFLQLRKTSGETVNPCEKSIWSEVKLAFENMSPEERHIYEGLAEESRVQAGIAKARRQQQLRFNKTENSQPSTSTSTALAERPACGSMLHAHVLPAHQLCNALANPEVKGVQELQSCIEAYQEQSASVSGKVAKATYPQTEATLESFWKSNLASGITGKQFVKNFQSQTETIARPADGIQDVFPEKVIHESFCGEQCRHFGDRKRINLHMNLLRLFISIVAKTLALA